MNSIKLTVLISMISFSILAQPSSPEIFSSVGGTYAETDIRLDWTLGEIAIETIQNTELRITQGFHQPNYLVSTVNELQKNIGDIKVYPNPLTNFLKIDIDLENQKKVLIQMASSSGEIIWTESSYARVIKAEKEMDNLAVGVYFVYIMIENQTQSFTITKIR